MKKTINALLGKFGYCIAKARMSDDPFKAMQHLLRKKREPVIFDVGAYHGNTVRVFRELFPKSEIYAFEPFLDSFRTLNANTAHDVRTKVYNMGFSDTSGIKQFHSNQSSMTNSLLSTDEQGKHTWGVGLFETNSTVEAQFDSLDSFLEKSRILSIDLLKLDVQGAELMVLSGAATACMNKKIKCIYTEIILQPTYKGQLRFDEFLEGFFDHGFDLYGIYNFNRSQDGRLRQIDAIFTAINY